MNVYVELEEEDVEVGGGAEVGAKVGVEVELDGEVEDGSVVVEVVDDTVTVVMSLDVESSDSDVGSMELVSVGTSLVSVRVVEVTLRMLVEVVTLLVGSGVKDGSLEVEVGLLVAVNDGGGSVVSMVGRLLEDAGTVEGEGNGTVDEMGTSESVGNAPVIGTAENRSSTPRH